MGKIRVGIVFGGRSGEHEVSVRSAASIYKALNRDKYEVELVGIDKSGGWHVVDQNWLPSGAEMKSLTSGQKAVVPVNQSGQVELADKRIDVFFPIVHGTFGEDGTLQGMFELLNAAYVGAGVLGSAVGMDKDVMKRLWIQAGLPVGEYRVVKNKLSDDEIRKAASELEWPIFVKPANMGSSVGVYKAENDGDLNKAVEKASQYDHKVLLEKAIVGKEIEVSVLGNEDPQASVPGEVKSTHDFYDYEAKYIDENGAELEIPAKLPKEKIEEIQRIAVEAFRVLECEGMARVDMFLQSDGKVVLNEINTLPGFTSISMYPKLWEASGLPYEKLLERLIDLAIDRKKKKDRLKRSYTE